MIVVSKAFGLGMSWFAFAAMSGETQLQCRGHASTPSPTAGNALVCVHFAFGKLFSASAFEGCGGVCYCTVKSL